MNNATGTRKTPSNATGSGSSGTRKLSSIELPDKTIVSFVYSYDTKYSGADFALSKIKISDTAFRFGYLLNYDSTYTFIPGDYGQRQHPEILPIKLLLKSITPYTKTEKQKGYQFSYWQPFFPKAGSYGDSLYNKTDHWGYYNWANNGDSLIPRVNNYTWGADRNPNTTFAYANMLSLFKLW